MESLGIPIGNGQGHPRRGKIRRKNKRGGKRSGKSRLKSKYRYESLFILGNNCFG